MSTALVMSNHDDPFDHNRELSLSPSNARHSIDLTLELERQLELESPPASPMRNARPQSLDTTVLASIVTQLRMSLDEMTRERESLSEQLAEARFNETNLKEALATVTEKCVQAEADLATAKDQHKEDQEAISMLRQKVEESRRALMRLQTESRRMSHASNLTLDMSRPGATAVNGPPSSRRASTFAPLTGSPMGHRRISSLSDPGLMSAPNVGEHGQWSTSPAAGSVDFSQAARAGPAMTSGHGRRVSSIFGRGPPSPLADIPSTPSFDISELGALRKEVQSLKEQLEETKHELNEAHEAKEASEMCVRALRTFIAENSVGEQTTRGGGMKSAPAAPNSAAPSRWGFKLWNSTEVQPPVISPAPSSASAPAVSPVTRKLGGLFSPRSSISSVASPARPPPVPLPQEPPFHGSDTSSIADSTTEPASPASSLPKVGVLVRDAETMSLDVAALPGLTKTVVIPA